MIIIICIPARDGSIMNGELLNAIIIGLKKELNSITYYATYRHKMLALESKKGRGSFCY